ncbi:hypothetical protein BGZ73_005204 [Actinomortierella ambigua]|nr:hypothetical protein BGZ73_005204 [Actinomortierella ambigua]
MANHPKKPILTLFALLAMIALHASHDPKAVASAATTEVYIQPEVPMSDPTVHPPAMSRRRLGRRGEYRGGGVNPALERSQSSTMFTQTDCRVRWTDSCSNGTGSGGYNGGYNGGGSYDSGYNPNLYNSNGYANGGRDGDSGSYSSDEHDYRPSEHGGSSSRASSGREERRKRRHLVDNGHVGGVRRRQLGRRMDTEGQLDRRYVPMSGGIGGQFSKESAQGRR